MSKNLQTLAQTYLFAYEGRMTKDGVPEATQQRLLRMRDGYNYWLRYPLTSTSELVYLLDRKSVV